MHVCGLLIECPGREPTPVPLTGVSVQARIIDLVAEVTIEQRYVNRETQPIEAVYLFPLDEGAGVCKFTAEVDGRSIEGVVKKTEEAQTDYEQAIQSGHSAFLVEEKLPDVFKAKVGNLAAGSGAKIRLTYVTELKVEGGEIRFYLPTTIAPRYVPPTDHSSVAKDLASINYTQESHYRVDFNATVRMGSAIKEIRSPTHKIAVSHDSVNKPMDGTLKLDDVVTSMDRDLVVYIKVAEPNQPRLIHEKSSNGSTAVMLSLVPSFKLAEQKTELIFLVDRSGSMAGSGIEQAKQALKLFLHSLPTDCYVNIAGFGFSYEELFPSSRKYDEVVLNHAKAYAEQLQANLGGTEIFNPLEQIFQKPPIDGYLRQVFVLTDGEVSNADQVLGLVRRHSGRTRLFALGLGSSASHHLVEGMARAGNGTALFASLEERLEKKVMQQLQDALQPALTDIKINWEGYDETEQSTTPAQPVQTEKTLMGYGKPLVDPEASVPPTEKPEMKLRQAPCDKMIPPVFDGKHFIVYALLADDAHQPKWAEVIAASPVGPLSLKVHLNEQNSEEGQLVHCLAARKLIQLLQDREENDNAKKEIIQLGCRYGLTSRYTSYVAVDPKEQKDLKESWMMMKSRDIPVQVAHGWGGGSRMRRGAPVPMCMDDPVENSCTSFGAPPPMAMPMMSNRAPMMKSMQRSVQPQSLNDPMSLPSLSLSRDVPAFESLIFDASTDDRNQPKENTDDDKLMKLVSSQNFDGSFKLETSIAQLLDTTTDDITQAGQKSSYPDQVWVTAIALAYMTLALAQLQTSWMLVAKKAEKWLQSQHLADQDACKMAAQEYVKAKLHL
ncbi:von Willebrand factor A domain-containing protein 5A-like [Daphnia pulex]|uniref:von Willebrand factor A domain-containing protein 5A-like n=1 Tax=Daphnia pulex TaxID=6669 RepID=UPI001EE0CACC|nr:von Willebrand factor A domain-containing protein 5A-like [Daphnia pulex]